MSGAPSGATLIYALGGGQGHLRRALALARRLGGPCTVLHQAGLDQAVLHRAEDLPAEIELVRLPAEATRDSVARWMARALDAHDHLVVDTFPGGIARELGDELFGRVQTTLVARAVIRERYPDYDALTSRFDQVWLPYPADRCEWDEPPRGAYVGPLVRSVRWTGPRVPVLVIGDPCSAPAGWEPLLRGAAVVDGPFAALPHAERVVALAAGYNLGWELWSAGATAAFRPLPRRYDDQHRRAALLGALLCHRADLERFLEAGDVG